jgi:hypothetical protein
MKERRVAPIAPPTHTLVQPHHGEEEPDDNGDEDGDDAHLHGEEELDEAQVRRLGLAPLLFRDGLQVKPHAVHGLERQPRAVERYMLNLESKGLNFLLRWFFYKKQVHLWVESMRFRAMGLTAFDVCSPPPRW